VFKLRIILTEIESFTAQILPIKQRFAVQFFVVGHIYRTVRGAWTQIRQTWRGRSLLCCRFVSECGYLHAILNAGGSTWVVLKTTPGFALWPPVQMGDGVGDIPGSINEALPIRYGHPLCGCWARCRPIDKKESSSVKLKSFRHTCWAGLLGHFKDCVQQKLLILWPSSWNIDITS